MGASQTLARQYHRRCRKCLVWTIGTRLIPLLQNFVWFNIGSVDSFERNLENAQIEMNIEPPNFLPVIYKTEVEAASLSGILPTLLVIGFLIYMMRRSAEMMGGKKGRRGGGLFGGVMESTAKLINSNDIGVRFKSVSLL
jgi:AFG3 family protein